MTDKRKFEIVYDTELPGTPERVWEAVTKDTPAWMFPTDQWPAVRTVDEYPRHLVSRMDGPDGWFNQLEHVLEPLDGGRARLHYVHSGIFADNWDQQYDGASKHTEFYLHTLGQYLKYFDGKPVVFTDIQAPPPRQTPDGFVRLKKALGVEGCRRAARWSWSSTASGGSRGKWTSPTRTSSACAPRTRCTGSSAATPSAPGRHDGPRLQRQRGFRGHGGGLGRLPGEGLRLAGSARPTSIARDESLKIDDSARRLGAVHASHRPGVRRWRRRAGPEVAAAAGTRPAGPGRSAAPAPPSPAAPAAA